MCHFQSHGCGDVAHSAPLRKHLGRHGLQGLDVATTYTFGPRSAATASPVRHMCWSAKPRTRLEEGGGKSRVGGGGSLGQTLFVRQNNAEYCWLRGAAKHASGPQNGTRRSHTKQSSVAARSGISTQLCLRTCLGCWSREPSTPPRPDISHGRSNHGGSLHLAMLVGSHCSCRPPVR